MILIDLSRPHAVPMFDPLTHLVYSCAKSDVRHVFVGGRQVVRDGALTRFDIADTLAEVEALVPRIAASIAHDRAPGDRLAAAHASIAARAGAPVPTGLILGSGLGRWPRRSRTRWRSPTREIAGFPVSTAPGHAGRLVIGRPARRAGGDDAGAAAPLRGLERRRGRAGGLPAQGPRGRRLIVTNAAGALNPDFAPGDVMLIEDHLNFTGANPLTGPNDDRLGLRFPDLSRAYDPALRDAALAGGRGGGLRLQRGHLRGRRRALARDLGRAALPARRPAATRSACPR